VVDRRRHLGQQRRVAVGHPEHDDPDTHACRPRGGGGQESQAIEARTLGVAEQGDEMVVLREPVEPEVLADSPPSITKLRR
jgi:hypothetical protein